MGSGDARGTPATRTAVLPSRVGTGLPTAEHAADTGREFAYPAPLAGAVESTPGYDLTVGL